MASALFMAELLAVLALLLAASAFFSGTETSIMSSNRIRMRKLADGGDERAKKVVRAFESPERTLTTILVGNNIVNVSASAIATFLAVTVYGDIGVAIATGVMTFVILVFGEITPKVLGAKHAEYIARRVAGPLEVVTKALYPFVRFFEGVTDLFLRISGTNNYNKGLSITEEEFKMLARIGASEGSIEAHEKDIIHKVFEFTDKRAMDVMHPRSKIVAVEGGENLGKAVELFRKHGYSSLPVYRRDFDDIIGIVSVKDILRFECREFAHVKVEELIKPVVIVSEKKRVPHVLEEMQDRGINIAIVLDEGRKVSGILSIEDLLEELVGDLHKDLDGEAYPQGGT